MMLWTEVTDADMPRLNLGTTLLILGALLLMVIAYKAGQSDTKQQQPLHFNWTEEPPCKKTKR